MDVIDSIEDDVGAGVDEVDRAAKTGGLRIAPSPVKTSSEVGEDGERKVPGIKIIGLSSELKKAMAGEEDSKDTSVEDEEEEEDEDDEDGEEEEEEDDEDEEEVEDDASSVEAIEVEPPAKVVKTP